MVAAHYIGFVVAFATGCLVGSMMFNKSCNTTSFGIFDGASASPAPGAATQADGADVDADAGVGEHVLANVSIELPAAAAALCEGGHVAIPPEALRYGTEEAVVDGRVQVPGYHPRDNGYLEYRGCDTGLKNLWAFRKAQAAATCRKSLWWGVFLEPIREICLDSNPLRGQCVVFSFGISWDFRFDDLMHDRGCKVYSFDPSMEMNATIRHEDPLTMYEPIGIADYDGLIEGGGTFYQINEHFRGPPYEVRTLRTLMEKHGVQHIDLLRLDVEGAEFEVIKGFNTHDTWRYFDQIVWELHYYSSSGEAFKRGIDDLAGIPFAPFYVASNELTGTEYDQDFQDEMYDCVEIGHVAQKYRERRGSALRTIEEFEEWGIRHARYADERKRGMNPGKEDVHGIYTFKREPPVKRPTGAWSDWQSLRDYLSDDHHLGRCEYGVQVIEEEPIRLCTSLLEQSRCAVYIFSNAADPVLRGHDALAELLSEERNCTTVEVRVGAAADRTYDRNGRVLSDVADTTRAGWLNDVLVAHGHDQLHGVRIAADAARARELLSTDLAPYMKSIQTISLNVPVERTRANVPAVAAAIQAVPAEFGPPQWTGNGRVVEGGSVHYELQYARQRD